MKFLESCSPSFRKFFAWSSEYLEKHGKRAVIVNTGALKMDGIRCGGWCGDDEIVAAFKNPLFEQTFVHEFSHMQQNIEESPYWKDTSLFWRHLEKDKVAINSWESVLDIIALERDCERRALAHSKKWKLFNTKKYAKNANLYLHYYQYVFLKRRWLNSTSIYHPYLVKEMPEKLAPLSSFAKIDMGLMKLFEDCLDKKGEYYKAQRGRMVST